MNLDELLDLFRQFNAKLFESQLQICSIEFTERLPKCSMGHWDPASNRISIRKGLFDSQQRITLLHEMIHMRIDGHGADFQAELARCAVNSCPGFQQVILSELQRVKDFDHYGGNDPDTLFRSVLLQLAIDHQGRSWGEIRKSAFEAINEAISTPLDETEFAQIEKKLSGIWDSIGNGSIGDWPSTPPTCKQKKKV